MSDEPLHSRFSALRIERAASQQSTSDSESESPVYTFCNNAQRLEQFSATVQELMNTPNPWQKPHVVISCEGRDLGRVGGRLSLVAIGVREEIYLLDVLAYSKNLEILKGLLENKDVEKIVWDGRNMFSELWHGHEISLNGVMDLQLLHVYENTSRRSARGFHYTEDLRTGYEGCEEKAKDSQHIDLNWMTRLQDEIKRKEEDDKDFWLRRPLRISSLEYASFRIMQLRTLYTFYLDRLPRYHHLHEESQRYAELYTSDRPPAQALYLDQPILPQEILERGPEVKDRFDVMGRRTCAGCRRGLHQDSFRDSFARRWTLRLGEHGRMCYSCSEAWRLSREQRKHALPSRLEQREDDDEGDDGVE